MRRRSCHTTNHSDAEGEEDSNKSNSNSGNDNYSVNDDTSKDTDSDDGNIDNKEGDHKGEAGNVEVDNGIGPDFNCLCKITYLERLFDEILSQHHGHNKGGTLKQQCGEKIANNLKTWTIIFSNTCPSCIQCAPKLKPIAGLRNIITLGLGIHGQVDLLNFQSMPNGTFRFLLNCIYHGVKIIFLIPSQKRHHALP